MNNFEITDELIEKYSKWEYFDGFTNLRNIIYAFEYAINQYDHSKINPDIYGLMLISILRIYRPISYNIFQNGIKNKINQMASEVEDQYNITKNWIFSNQFFRNRYDVDAEFVAAFSEKHNFNFNIRLEKKYHGNNR